MKPLPWVVMLLPSVIIGFLAGFLLGFILIFLFITIVVYGMALLFPKIHKVTIYRAGIAYEDPFQTILAPWEVITGMEQKNIQVKVNTTMKSGNFSIPKKHPQAQAVIDAVQGWLTYRAGAARRPWG